MPGAGSFFWASFLGSPNSWMVNGNSYYKWMVYNAKSTPIKKKTIYFLVGGRPTPLKNDGVRQFGMMKFPIYGKS
jgi:hypothetical protein